MRTSLWLLYIVGLFWRIMTDRIAKIIWQMWIVFSVAQSWPIMWLIKTIRSYYLSIPLTVFLPLPLMNLDTLTNYINQCRTRSEPEFFSRYLPFWWQSCRAFNCRILYGRYLPNQQSYLYWYSITHSLFHSRLKTFLFCKSFPLQPFLFFFSTTWSTTCSRLHVVLHVASVKGSTEQHFDYMHL